MLKTEIIEIKVKQERVIECHCDICGEEISCYYDYGVYRAPWNLIEHFHDEEYAINEVRYHFCSKCIEEKIKPLLKEKE